MVCDLGTVSNFGDDFAPPFLLVMPGLAKISSVFLFCSVLITLWVSNGSLKIFSFKLRCSCLFKCSLSLLPTSLLRFHSRRTWAV